MILVYHFFVVMLRLGPKSLIFSYSCCNVTSNTISNERKDQQANEFESWWLLLPTPPSAMICLITLFNLFPLLLFKHSITVNKIGFHSLTILYLSMCNFSQHLPLLSKTYLPFQKTDGDLTMNESLYKICYVKF